MSAKHKFNRSSKECNSNSYYYKPAVTFEVLNGLNGISGDYKFPNGMTASEFEVTPKCSGSVFSYYDFPQHPIKNHEDFKPATLKQPFPKEMLAELNFVLDELIELNPDLKKIQYDKNNPLEVFNVINGVACLLNTDDIQFFIETGKKSYMALYYAYQNEEYRNLHIEINDKVEKKLGWIPSLKTMKAIKKQISTAKVKPNSSTWVKKGDAPKKN